MPIRAALGDEIVAIQGPENRLMVCVYRIPEFGDMSNGGISAHHSRIYVVNEDHEPSLSLIGVGEDAVPAVWIVRRGGYLRAVPVGLAERWGMFGGCFIYSSDSRFTAVSAYPIPLHDRVED